MQTAFASICYRGAEGRNTGKALSEFEGLFGSAPGGKKILFLMTTGKSDDDVAGPAQKIVVKGTTAFKW